jgi:hypothetical protein
VVCWICGDEHDPELTASVLAAAVDTIEQAISSRAPAYFVHWASLLRLFGMHQRAEDVEADLDAHRKHVRSLKEAGLGHPDAWLAAKQ